MPKSGRRITDHTTRLEIQRRYEEEEETCAEIGAALGINQNTVRNVLIAAGVQMRKPARRYGPLRTKST